MAPERPLKTARRAGRPEGTGWPRSRLAPPPALGPLKERRRPVLKGASRHRDEPRKIAIRMAIWAIKNAEVEKGAALGDADVLALLGREAKRRRAGIAGVEEG